MLESLTSLFFTDSFHCHFGVFFFTGRITKFAGEAQQDQINLVIFPNCYLSEMISDKLALAFQFAHAFEEKKKVLLVKNLSCL